ncbi:MAG: YraN family protein [Mycobacteriales bacterium]
MRAKDAVGAYGERVARRFLESAGLRIIETNWRCPGGELDIVAEDGDVLVVCEVKTRSSLAYGVPAEAVIGAKAARIRRLAVSWLAENGSGWRDIRFDVVSVVRNPRGSATVEHLIGVL